VEAQLSDILLSIIIPDEYANCSDSLRQNIDHFKNDQQVEVHYISKSAFATRAERLNKGFEKSVGRFILFHHPRSSLTLEAIEDLKLLAKASKPIWGGFKHKFDTQNFLLNFTSFYSNYIRFKRGVVYLDHCIFFNRQLWKEKLPLVPIFEDTLLSYQFRAQAKPLLLNHFSTTSAIRFKKNGLVYQILLNQILKLGFFIGIDFYTLNSFYEKGLKLNDPK
jgi:hypothetical protein